MKKLYLIILGVLLSLTAISQTIGDAFYIYRNDGQFNAFFRDEVEKMEYSCYDLDSVLHDDYVSQVVYTPDSIYRIPLEVIDSVGFVQPETILKEDAIPLTGSLFDYLISVDSLILTFSASIPSTLLPNVGDKLVATDLTDKLPLGFTGRVRQVQQEANGYVVTCDSLLLEEAVSQFYGVVKLVSLQSNSKERHYLQRRANSMQTHPFSFDIPTINQKLDLSPIVKPKDIYKISGKVVATATIKPIMTGKITRVVDNILNISHYNIHAVTDVETVTQVEIVGEVANKDNPFKKFCLEATRPGPWGIPIYYAVGPRFEIEGDLAFGTTIYANFSHTEDITYYPLTTAVGLVVPGLSPIVNQVNTVSHHIKMTHFDTEWPYVAGKFSARLGVFGRMGIAFGHHSVGWIGGELQGGARIDAELGFDFEALSNAKKGTGFYDGLKDMAKITIMPYWGLEAKIVALDERIKFTFLGRDNYSFWGKKLEYNFLPIFSDTKAAVNSTSKTSVDVSTNITNDCLIPYTVGFSLFDGNNNRIGEPQWNNQKFWTRSGFTLPLKSKFTDLATDKKYKVYPTLKLLGFTVLASPSAELDMHFPVTLSGFEVTKKQYEKGAFTNDGVKYDYRFDATVTATLDADAIGIAEWGYAYLDPNGREALIPLNQFGRSYTDSRWAYFRNESKSSCTLYGYVKYVGDDEYYYGEPHDYPLEYGETTCPDDNHPHMIDLGLPSGTKWACCNVGASKPEEYGGYYAWGEITTKSLYDWVTYQYYQNGQYVNIGTDIAGTSYDAATANWGAPWCMPSLEQTAELLNYTTSQWNNQNGVYGRKFTGSNGGSVFLPAAGGCSECVLQNGDGYYWSSSLTQYDSHFAYYLWFHSVDAYWGYNYDRHSGYAVRPVCKN